ncbi:HD domain-containing protein [Thermosporothrix hazakensis]|jgi:putative nucleotidyltransferase with HDIG domain|nr:HD domain-containing protein [Thermosporothrix hazakensis]GCE46985.1 polynucleotide adenylyltransferase [Thermosporothrix hazakensis]
MKITLNQRQARMLSVLPQTSAYFESQQQQAYLVGGSVRDLLHQQPCKDWDIVSTGDAHQLARKLANHLDAYYAQMNEKASRITLKPAEEELILDIAPLHGTAIEADLQERDFTINAIAIPLPNLVAHLTSGTELQLLDPLHGVDDLHTKTLRATGDAVFQRDPLRLLRAIRFMTTLQFSIEPQTAEMLTRDANLLPQTASERIREEFYTILKPDGAASRLHYMDKHGLFTALIPEFIPARGMPQPSLHNWDVLEHSIETVAALEKLSQALDGPPEKLRESRLNHNQTDDIITLQALLKEAEEQHLYSREALTSPPMKLAALLHDIGKTTTYAVDNEGHIHFYHHPQAGVPLARQIMHRLGASNAESRLVQQVVAHHMRPGQLSGTEITQRAIRRYFVDLGPVGINVALVSLADHLAMRGPQDLTEAWQRHLSTVVLLLTRYIRERDRILPPRVITPQELIHRLNLKPGPIIGQLLEMLSEAQAEGIIHSKEDALWFASEKLNELKKEAP